jgi:hypothetical protein
LAASRISSSSPDWLDVVEVLSAFQEMNNVTIQLSGRVGNVAGERSLNLEFQAYDRKTQPTDQLCLASVHCQIGSHAHRTMEGAVMWALYRLDYELASLEMRNKN